MAIEANFDISYVAALALREKQIQQNYRPIIAVHKWFARRPGTLFRSLLLAEFAPLPLAKSFYESHDLSGLKILDPFMGGGTPLLEANRLGCDVTGFDINPMAAWIVQEEIEHLDLGSYRKQSDLLIAALRKEVGMLYQTDCPTYGDKNVPVKYFLWVKTLSCGGCGRQVDLFPGYLIADDTRHPLHVLVCSKCGELNEVLDPQTPNECSSCHAALVIGGPAKRGACKCECGFENRYPRANAGPLEHRLFAIEYYNPKKKAAHKGRFFKKPDAKDLARAQQSVQLWKQQQAAFAPKDRIPAGDETNRLHRWGYGSYRELFNERQLLGLEFSCRFISEVKDLRVRHALATNLSDLLRYQNMLCRYDTMALKSLDIFSVHGFPVGLIQCESNLLGVVNSKGVNVGSGGWGNIIEKYAKAKRYCDHPFEIFHSAGKKTVVPIRGEWIGEHRDGQRRRDIAINCGSAADAGLDADSFDGVFTDPPYFENVQYGELMDFCYVWLRSLVRAGERSFNLSSSRSSQELTGNETHSRGIETFAEGLAKVYRAGVDALKPGAPFVFTFHHNRFKAYEAIAVAILDAGLKCTASPPCPAEMSGSIHISGTNSSIIDTVFVCRKKPTDQICQFTLLSDIVMADIAELQAAGVKVSVGDLRCVLMGHVTRLAIDTLADSWDAGMSTRDKLAAIHGAAAEHGDLEKLVDSLRPQIEAAHRRPTKEKTKGLFDALTL